MQEALESWQFPQHHSTNIVASGPHLLQLRRPLCANPKWPLFPLPLALTGPADYKGLQ